MLKIFIHWKVHCISLDFNDLFIYLLLISIFFKISKNHSYHCFHTLQPLCRAPSFPWRLRMSKLSKWKIDFHTELGKEEWEKRLGGNHQRSLAHRFQLSFRSVGFRIYAFPILDDISYFFADSSSSSGWGKSEGKAGKTSAAVDDDDVRLLLLLYGFA